MTQITKRGDFWLQGRGEMLIIVFRSVDVLYMGYLVMEPLIFGMG